jgi:CheY-like chemotaxis protein
MADKKKILVVDDDPDFQFTTSAALTAAGSDVEQCLDSRRALDRIRATHPDLVILDVMMERGTSGFDIAQQLRREPGLARLPVLMLTAIHQSTKLRFSPETDGEYLPVDQFLDKPVRPEVLVTRVAELLKAAGQ